MSDTSDISDMGRDDSVLAAEYALGLLSAEERGTAASRLAAEPALRADLRFWLSRLSSLDDGFAETAPPASAWAAIDKRLFAAASRQTGWWNSLALWRSFAGAAAAIAIVAVSLNVMGPRPDPNTFAAQLVAALSAQGSNVQVVALYNAQSGEVRLTALSGDKVADKDYQLWAIQGDAAPKSLGLIKIDARTDVKLPADVLAAFGPGTTLAISLEPLGGSPNAGPTGPVVAAGKAMPI
jgi:anti-sigma-K factor RskA